MSGLGAELVRMDYFGVFLRPVVPNHLEGQLHGPITARTRVSLFCAFDIRTLGESKTGHRELNRLELNTGNLSLTLLLQIYQTHSVNNLIT